MASLLAENWSCIDMDTNDHFPGAEASSSNMSNALLMSLLEETQGDQEHDEERLSSLIRALEVELEPTTSEGHECFMDNSNQFGSSNQEGFDQLFDLGYASDGDCSATDAPGFSWTDMEIGSSSGGTDESVDWYMDSCLDGINCTSSFGGSHEFYKGSTSSASTTPFQEHEYQNLWQETYCNTKDACIVDALPF